MHDWKRVATLNSTWVRHALMASLQEPTSVSQWSPISIQHLPITIAMRGKERAQSKKQTQTCSEILQSQRAWFLSEKLFQLTAMMYSIRKKNAHMRETKPSCHRYDTCIHPNLSQPWSAINLGLGGTKPRVKSPSLFKCQDPIITEIPSPWLWKCHV